MKAALIERLSLNLPKEGEKLIHKMVTARTTGIEGEKGGFPG